MCFCFSSPALAPSKKKPSHAHSKQTSRELSFCLEASNIPFISQKEAVNSDEQSFQFQNKRC